MTQLEACACCGKPTTHPETHHHNQRRGDNHPDNLQPRDRRCHHTDHDNPRAVDHLTKHHYGPPGPTSLGP